MQHTQQGAAASQQCIYGRAVLASGPHEALRKLLQRLPTEACSWKLPNSHSCKDCQLKLGGADSPCRCCISV
jgi:hypothetical protein